MAAPPEVDCPTCKRRTVFAPSNRWRPFCSERCRQIDLGAWATEQFRVPGQAPTDSSLGEADGTAAAPSAPH